MCVGFTVKQFHMYPGSSSLHYFRFSKFFSWFHVKYTTALRFSVKFELLCDFSGPLDTFSFSSAD